MSPFSDYAGVPIRGSGAGIRCSFEEAADDPEVGRAPDDRATTERDLTVEYESLPLPGDPDTTLYVYTTEPDSPSRRAMDILASWTASDDQLGRRAST